MGQQFLKIIQTEMFPFCKEHQTYASLILLPFRFDVNQYIVNTNLGIKHSD